MLEDERQEGKQLKIKVAFKDEEKYLFACGTTAVKKTASKLGMVEHVILLYSG